MFKLRCIVRHHRYRTKGYVTCQVLMATLIEADTREAHGTAEKVSTFKRMSAFGRTKAIVKSTASLVLCVLFGRQVQNKSDNRLR